MLAELDELDGHHIQDLGNWNVDVRQDVYSVKLPMKAMQVMGGHPEAKGSVFCQEQVFNLLRIYRRGFSPLLKHPSLP